MTTPPPSPLPLPLPFSEKIHSFTHNCAKAADLRKPSDDKTAACVRKLIAAVGVAPRAGVDVEQRAVLAVAAVVRLPGSPGSRHRCRRWRATRVELDGLAVLPAPHALVEEVVQPDPQLLHALCLPPQPPAAPRGHVVRQYVELM